MLRLTNTLTRQVEDIGRSDGVVKMYSCGPTVYRPVHIGNLRTFILADLVRRALLYHGLGVRSVMNITDVGHMTDELTDEGRDRMLLAAEDEGLSASEIAVRYTDIFFDDIRAVNIEPFDVYPRATDHIPQIVDLVNKLIERDHAYEVDGTVYYDVTTFPDYGRLSGQSLEDMRAGHRLEGIDPAKRNHQDFTLWVAAGPRRELVFDSPWGPGYPGWHIECSAMSMHHLGEHIDVHTGGTDNRFPHHEDEIAQSEGAVGHRVVGMWVHGEHLLLDQAKMAKSAGNVMTIGGLTDAGFDPLAFRYLCFTARYRRQVHFSHDALAAAQTALRRLREQVAMLGPPATVPSTGETLASTLDDAAGGHHRAFTAAIDDDLDLPAAVATLHRMLGDDRIPPDTRSAMAASWDRVLGLDLVGSDELDARLEALIRERETARDRKDYARADEIRDRLRAEGIELLDSAEGTRFLRRR